LFTAQTFAYRKSGLSFFSFFPVGSGKYFLFARLFLSRLFINVSATESPEISAEVEQIVHED
jgi:hypothetical protein